MYVRETNEEFTKIGTSGSNSRRTFRSGCRTVSGFGIPRIVGRNYVGEEPYEASDGETPN
jgi:hypothetical protein